MPDTNREDGELDRGWVLWDVRVVVEDVMVFDEFHQVVEDQW
jgi:hypothetical protein